MTLSLMPYHPPTLPPNTKLGFNSLCLCDQTEIKSPLQGPTGRLLLTVFYGGGWPAAAVVGVIGDGRVGWS